jgi:hypothetical protein
MEEKKDQEGKETPLNKTNDDEPQEINRGLELLLRKKQRRERRPKTFELRFGKLVSLFNREINFYFNVHLDIKKVSSRRD